MSEINITNYLTHSPHMFLDADILGSESFSLTKFLQENYSPFQVWPNISQMVYSVKNAQRTLASYIQVPSNIFQLKALIIKLIDPNLTSEEKKAFFQSLDEKYQNQLIRFLPENVNISDNPSELLNYWVDDQNIIEAYIDALISDSSFQPSLVYKSKLLDMYQGFSHLSEAFYNDLLIYKINESKIHAGRSERGIIEAILIQNTKCKNEAYRFALAKEIIMNRCKCLGRMHDLIDLFNLQNPKYKNHLIAIVQNMLSVEKVKEEEKLIFTIQKYCRNMSIDIPDGNTAFDKLYTLLKNGHIEIIKCILNLSFFSKEQKFALIISTGMSYEKNANEEGQNFAFEFAFKIAMLLDSSKFRFNSNENKELINVLLENNLYVTAAQFLTKEGLDPAQFLNIVHQYIANGYPQYVPAIISRDSNSNHFIDLKTKWELAEQLMKLGYAHEVLICIKGFELNKIEDIDKRIEFLQALVRSSVPSKLPIIATIINEVDIPFPEAHLLFAQYDFTIHKEEMLCFLSRYHFTPTEEKQFLQHILSESKQEIFSAQSNLSQAIISALELIELNPNKKVDYRKKAKYLSECINDMNHNAAKIYQQMILKDREIDPKLALISLPFAICLSKDGWDHFPTNFYELIKIQNMLYELTSNLSSLINNYEEVRINNFTPLAISHIFVFQVCMFSVHDQQFKVKDSSEVYSTISSLRDDLRDIANCISREALMRTMPFFINKWLQIEITSPVDALYTLYMQTGLNLGGILNKMQLALDEKKELFTRVLDLYQSENSTLQINYRAELIDKISKYGNTQVAFDILTLFCSHYTSRTSELFNYLAKKPSLLMPSMLIAKMLANVDEETLPESTKEAISHTIYRLHRDLKDTNKLTTWNEFCLELNQIQDITPFEKVQLLHLAMIDQEGKNNHELLIHIINNFRFLLFVLQVNKKDALLQIYQNWQDHPSISIQEQLTALTKLIISDDTFLELSNDEDIQKFIQTFIYNARNPLVLLSYINCHKNSRSEIQEEIKRFVKSVMSNSFKETRYETTNNPHLTKIKREHESIYNRWREPVHIEPISAYFTDVNADVENGTDWSLFLKEKLEHQHWSAELFPKLAEFISLPKEQQNRALADYQEQAASNESPAELKIMELLSIESENVLAKLEEIEQELRKIDPTMELINDIQGQLTLLSSIGSDFSQNFVIQDTDEWEDLFLSGTEVVGSCQRVDGSPNLNQALLAYVIDGKNRMIAIKNKKGNIIGCQIFRLLWNPQTNQPCIFMEPLYSAQNNAQINNIMLNYAKKRASEIGCELFVVGKKPNSNRAKLESLGSCSPFEYTDTGNPRMAERGIFAITNFFQIPLESYSFINHLQIGFSWLNRYVIYYFAYLFKWIWNQLYRFFTH